MSNNPFSLSASYVNLSQYTSIALADAAAVAGGFGLNIDKNYTLIANVVLLSPTVVFSGGVISLGNFNLTFGSGLGTANPVATSVLAPMAQIFSYTGTGVVKGTILANNICVEWWGAHSDGTNATPTRQAFQYAGNFTLQTQPRGGKVYCLGQTYLFDTTSLTFTSSAELPLFVGSGITPDATNIVFSPSSGAYAFNFIGGSAAPGGGGIDNVYFANGSNGGGALLNDAGFNKIRIGWASTGATAIAIVDTGSGFAEGNSLTLFGGINATVSAIDLSNSGGTGSVATTKIEPETNITLGSGNRAGVPVIDIGSGVFWYNGNCSGTILNAGATNAYVFKKTGSTPPCFISGNLKLEGSDSNPVGLTDPAGSTVYFGGTVTTQGTFTTDLKSTAFFTTMAYGSGGVIITNGGSLYQQALAQAGNTTFNFGGGGVGQQFKTFNMTVSNGDGSYVWYGTVICTMNGSGTATVVGSSLTTDTHSYGVPGFSVTGSALVMSNSNWPSGTFTANYSVVAP